jgi:hypothetical protein
MTKSITVQTIIAIAAAAAVAGVAVVMMPGAPQAQTLTGIEHALPQSHTKGDRLPLLVTGSACSLHSWPNYDASCQFDFRRSAGDVRTVRVLGLERRASTNVVVAGQ